MLTLNEITNYKPHAAANESAVIIMTVLITEMSKSPTPP